jgi:hypothetical protein
MGLGESEDLISLSDISEQISIGLLLNSLVGIGDIRLRLIGEAFVLFLNLLGGGRERDIEEAIVVLFQHSHGGIRCKSHSSYLRVRDPSVTLAQKCYLHSLSEHHVVLRINFDSFDIIY